MPNLATGSYFIWRKPVNVLVGYIPFLHFYLQCTVSELVYPGVALLIVEKFYYPTMAC